MDTLTQKWAEIFLGLLLMVGIVSLTIWGFSKLLPTNEELQQRKTKQLNWRETAL